MDRDEQYGVWDPSSALTGAAPAGNAAPDPFATATPADPWMAPSRQVSPTDPWAAGAQPGVAWGDESPTVVWPWGVEQSQATWGSPPAPGAMDFPAAEPPPAEPRWGPPDTSVNPVPPRPAPGRRRLTVVAGAVLAVLLGAGGVGMALRGGDDPAPGRTGAQPQTGGQAANDDGQPAVTPATPDPATTSPTTPPATSSPITSSPTPDRQAAAVAELERIYEQDRGSVSFNGQYVAQIASKYPGITDKLQTTADGSHRFEASDILAEYRELSSGHSSSDHPVVLLKSTDYGKHQIKNGHFLWVTFALGDFPSPQSVTVWCDSEFSDLSAAERENQCVARRLEP
jgi:hypothetical protein